ESREARQLLLAMDATKKGLLAFVQEMGFTVLTELLATEAEMLAGPKGKHLPEARRDADRPGHGPSKDPGSLAVDDQRHREHERHHSSRHTEREAMAGRGDDSTVGRARRRSSPTGFSTTEVVQGDVVPCCCPSPRHE